MCFCSVFLECTELLVTPFEKTYIFVKLSAVMLTSENCNYDGELCTIKEAPVKKKRCSNGILPNRRGKSCKHWLLDFFCSFRAEKRCKDSRALSMPLSLQPNTLACCWWWCSTSWIAIPGILCTQVVHQNYTSIAPVPRQYYTSTTSVLYQYQNLVQIAKQHNSRKTMSRTEVLVQ